MSEYEEREAARFGHYTWHDWQDLLYSDRVASMAHYRIFHLVDLHQNDAVAKEMERKQRQVPQG